MGLLRNIGPISHGSEVHTDVMKTQALKQALDAVWVRCRVRRCPPRRGEVTGEGTVFSLRNAHHRWDPKGQRPEPWQLYNGRKRRGESLRVFPLSNWTELDIWLDIHRESIPIVPLYFAAERPVVERDGMLVMVDDEQAAASPGEQPQCHRSGSGPWAAIP